MLQTILILAASVLTTVTAQLLLKKGVMGLGNLSVSGSNIIPLIFKLIQNGWLIAGLFFFGLSFFIWIVVLSKFQLNIVYPALVSVNFSLITIASWILFKEYLSLVQILGIGIIIFGTFLVFFKGSL